MSLSSDKAKAIRMHFDSIPLLFDCSASIHSGKAETKSCSNLIDALITDTILNHLSPISHNVLYRSELIDQLF